MTALPTFATEANALQVDVNAQQVSAAASATTATTAANSALNSAQLSAASAGATVWVSGTTYALGSAVISPANVQTYRRKVAGAGITDPSLDTANWARSVINPGDGGTTLTGSVTLTSTSPAAMVVTPSAYGLYITLPDATTMSRSTVPFSVYNSGDYDYGVKDTSGKQLGWIRPRTGAVIGLADNSSSAGVWATYGLEKVGVTATYTNATLSNMSNTVRRIVVDANRTCFLFGGTDVYGIVYDASSQAWGAATLIRSSVGSGSFLGALSATNQVLVVSCSSTTAIQAVTLTLSGTSITVNTAVNATGGGTWGGSGQIIAVGSSWVFSYADNTTPAGRIRAITVSGTVPTVGTEANIGTGTGSIAPILFASGNVVRTVMEHNGGGVIRFLPYTVSGTTLTVGTGGTTTLSASGMRAFLNGNGNIVLQYIATTHFAAILKLTGTVEAVSAISLGTAPSSITTTADCVPITASKTLFISATTSSQTWHANILTDTSGTASVGTELSGNEYGNISSVSGISASGNIGKFTSSLGSSITQWYIDCSGASPTISSANRLAISSVVPSPSPSDLYGVRNGFILTSSGVNYILGASLGYSAVDVQISTNSITKRVSVPTSSPSLAAIPGANSNESWLVGVFNNVSSTGQNLQRVEVAA